MRHQKTKHSLSVMLITCTLLLSMGLLGAESPPKLLDLNGGEHSLKEYLGKGKWLVVMVWASDCHVCNQEVHEMVALHKAHKDKDVQVLGIAIDGYEGKKDVQAFIDRHQVNFPNLIDDGSVVMKEYAEKVGKQWYGWTPTYLMYDPKGELSAQNIGAISQADIEKYVAGQAQARASNPPATPG
ncbi:MAG TPA: TlpA family protein disulfide reductase [Acidiferrobacteraceae bacterium]|nr:TlpA family protein disulfide reductase [Acidiferrobacteraceae bacterium]